ncbi:MAG: hypothetical protein ABSB63_12420 [Spirochaetia bacterium]|jgi:hypothetical protein
MKRTIIVMVISAALAATVSAQERAPDRFGFEQELSAALQDMSGTPLGTLTVGDLQKLAGRVSIVVQKIQYVQKVRRASFLLPGAGQFMTGDALGGSLFLAGDLALITGTLIGAYFLLPANVQFRDLDYFHVPLGSIRTAWESNSLTDYLPSIGLLAGGMVLKAVLGHFSAVNAEQEARTSIAEGKVTFTPNLDVFGRGFGMGVRMGF